MQGYRSAFARVYNQRWTGFAVQTAPLLYQHVESLLPPGAERSLLDLCCGTGQLAAYFLERGYRVIGLDLSPAMLEYARVNNAAHIVAGQALFIEGDAALFSLPEPVNVVISTFDALNHLPNLTALCSCFASVRRALLPGGIFVFDLNTRLGLQRWNSITIEDSEELMLINRGIFDPTSDKAFVRISGFVRLENGQFERFEEVVFNTVFDLNMVKAELISAGFEEIYFARGKALAQPVNDPEELERVFIIGRAPRSV
mgnify:CR=1 FL=1